MSQTVTGEGYRDFVVSALYECESLSQLEKIHSPVDKDFALIAANDGSANLRLFKFYRDSAAAANGSSVIEALNGRITGKWIEIPIAGASGGTSAGLAGSGSPEGVTTANPGTTYIDTTNEVFYVKKTGTGDTGWLELVA